MTGAIAGNAHACICTADVCANGGAACTAGGGIWTPSCVEHCACPAAGADGAACEGDVDASGNVDVNDLLALLSSCECSSSPLHGPSQGLELLSPSKTEKVLSCRRPVGRRNHESRRRPGRLRWRRRQRSSESPGAIWCVRCPCQPTRLAADRCRLRRLDLRWRRCTPGVRPRRGLRRPDHEPVRHIVPERLRHSGRGVLQQDVRRRLPVPGRSVVRRAERRVRRGGELPVRTKGKVGGGSGCKWRCALCAWDKSNTEGKKPEPR